MTALQALKRHRHKLLPIVVIAALLIGGLVFRDELSAWFSGRTVSESAASAQGTNLDVGPFAVNAAFAPDPPRQRENTLIVEVRDSEGKPVEGAEVSVRLRMPAMGAMQEMRAEADVSSRDDGRYDAQFNLPMGGSWELILGVQKGDQTAEVIANMTVGSPGLTLSDGGASKTGSKADAALPSYEFDAASLERLRAAFESYETIRALLANDSIEGLEGQAKQAQTALQAGASSGVDLPEPLRRALEKGSEAALKVAAASSATEARQAFGELSQQFVGLASADPRLAEGRHIFKCPMAEGYQKWIQKSPRLENPYMGQKMLECGVRTKWGTSSSAGTTPTAHSHSEGSDDVSHYTCSMHPSVKQDGPGECPICAMDLTPVTKGEVETGTIFVDEVRRQRIGVRTDSAMMRDMSLEIRAVGSVRYDESRLHDVSLRMSGWVQRLYVDETGQPVKAGQTLFTLYSPELYAAQLEHLAGLNRQSDGGEMLSQLAQASRTRLRLLGMSEAQISGLEKRGKAQENVPIPSPAGGYVIEKHVVDGTRVEAGMQAYRIADLSKVWIEAEIYETDLPHVRVDQSVKVDLPHAPGKTFIAKVDYIYPTLDERSRTGKARIVLENDDLHLKPDMFANVIIRVDLGKRLSIPESAVVYTGPRRLVFVDLSEGKLQPKVVELGVHAGGLYEVTSGLSEGDVVVTSGNFLIAAESRIRSAAKYWESSDAAE